MCAGITAMWGEMGSFGSGWRGSREYSKASSGGMPRRRQRSERPPILTLRFVDLNEIEEISLGQDLDFRSAPDQGFRFSVLATLRVSLEPVHVLYPTTSMVIFLATPETTSQPTEAVMSPATFLETERVSVKTIASPCRGPFSLPFLRTD